MNCASVRLVMDLYVEDLLSVGRKNAVDAHLKGCVECAAKAKRLRAPALPAAAAPAALKDRLRKAAGQAQAAREPAFDRREAGSAALALALALWVLALIHAASPENPSRRPVTSPAPVVWRLP